MKRLHYGGLLGMLLVCFAVQSWGSNAVIRVATRDMPPYSYQKDGQWQGLTIDLLRGLASDLHFTFSLEQTSLTNLIAGVKNGTYDLGASGISITADREQEIDFSQPYLVSLLGVIYNESENPWWSVVRYTFSFTFLRVVLALVIILLLAGFGVWLFERKSNPQFGGPPHHGLASAFWWSAVTITTVGYGDKAPKTPGGRCIAMIWMFSGLVVISVFTATVVTTLSEASQKKEKTMADWQSMNICAVQGSTGLTALKEHVIYPGLLVSNALEGVDAVINGTADGFIYDMPVLEYYKLRSKKKLHIMPLYSEHQHYGIVMPTDGAMNNDLNVALLKIVRSPLWDNCLVRYFGSKHSPGLSSEMGIIE